MSVTYDINDLEICGWCDDDCEELFLINDSSHYEIRPYRNEICKKCFDESKISIEGIKFHPDDPNFAQCTKKNCQIYTTSVSDKYGYCEKCLYRVTEVDLPSDKYSVEFRNWYLDYLYCRPEGNAYEDRDFFIEDLDRIYRPIQTEIESKGKHLVFHPDTLIEVSDDSVLFYY